MPKKKTNSLQKQSAYKWNFYKSAIDINGRIVDTSTDIWTLHSSPEVRTINWKIFGSSEVVDTIKAYIFNLIETLSPSSCLSAFSHLKYVLIDVGKFEAFEDLKFETFTEILTFLRNSNTEWKFGYLRRWYKWCCEQSIPGFYEEISYRLCKIKIKTNEVHLSIMTRDLDKGPFSEQEFLVIRDSIKKKKGSLITRVCIMLLLELGIRPAQLTLLNENDLQLLQLKDKKFYSLDIVRIKQGVVNKSEKKRRRISVELGEQIELIIKKNHELYNLDGIENPLFYSFCQSEKVSPLDKVYFIKNPQNKVAKARRMTVASLYLRLRNYAKDVNIISPHTGKTLGIFAYRFRYTFGTMQANQGTPSTVLAEMLDHSTMYSIQSYVKSTNTMANRLDKALGANETFTGLIAAFLGTVSPEKNKNISNVIFGTTPTLKNLGGIGNCGAKSLCKLYPPLSYYICPHFQAWADAPHEILLLELENYVEELRQKTQNAADRIPNQLKDTISALKELLLKIKERNLKERNGS